MAEQCFEALNCRPEDLRCAMPIHTKKITDSCRDKDCIEDLRVFLTQDSQAILDTAAGAKVRCAELIYTSVDVSPVTFNSGHYYIDLTFYYRIVADALVGTCRPASLYGLALFSKRAVLCGESGCSHIFSSDAPETCICSPKMPTAVVEVLDPMVLSSRVVTNGSQDPVTLVLPDCVAASFDDELVLEGDRQRIYVTLGQFSIIRLERDVQLIVPILDYSIPTKECCDSPGCAEDPCQVFSRIPFPATQFTPSCCAEQGGCSECRQSCN